MCSILYKFFDVKIVKTQCPADEMIQKITVDFEEYKQYAHFDLIPVWNIRMVEEKTGAYPELTIDQIHYDHCIYKGHFKKEEIIWQLTLMLRYGISIEWMGICIFCVMQWILSDGSL